MTAKDLMRAGRLSEARTVLNEEVRSAPGNVGNRTLLFQVLALHGEWDKALRHLDMISTQDPSRAIGVHAYLDIITAEKERLKVMQRIQQPSVMPEPPSYFGQYLEYLDDIKDLKYDDAKNLVKKIDKARPFISGTLNSKRFEGCCDTDARLYAFLEAFVHERYVWIPFETIRELVIHEPKTSFDLIWVMASITTWSGLTMNCCLPVLYPESFQHANEQIKMGRLTDWVPLGGGLSKGVGQHVYQIGQEDRAILDIRETSFQLPGRE
jgi:type VI secretion system protein ImpE